MSAKGDPFLLLLGFTAASKCVIVVFLMLSGVDVKLLLHFLGDIL